MSGQSICVRRCMRGTSKIKHLGMDDSRREAPLGPEGVEGGRQLSPLVHGRLHVPDARRRVQAAAAARRLTMPLVMQPLRLRLQIGLRLRLRLQMGMRLGLGLRLRLLRRENLHVLLGL